MAKLPHVPGHGLTHFWLLQLLSEAHSELTTHSGLQFGGFPKNVSKHEQEARFPLTLQIELGPHGFGVHGDGGGGSTRIFI